METNNVTEKIGFLQRQGRNLIEAEQSAASIIEIYKQLQIGNQEPKTLKDMKTSLKNHFNFSLLDDQLKFGDYPNTRDSLDLVM